MMGKGNIYNNNKMIKYLGVKMAVKELENLEKHYTTSFADRETVHYPLSNCKFKIDGTQQNFFSNL